MQSNFGEICAVRLALLRLKMGTSAAAAKWMGLHFGKGGACLRHVRSISDTLVMRYTLVEAVISSPVRLVQLYKYT